MNLNSILLCGFIVVVVYAGDDDDSNNRLNLKHRLFAKSSKAVSTPSNKATKSSKAFGGKSKSQKAEAEASCSDVQAKLDTCEAAATTLDDEHSHKITWEYPITKINGETPPGKLQPLVNIETMLDTTQSDGNRLVVTRGTRLAGTRVAIHVHE